MAVPQPLILDDADILIGDGAATEVLRSLACVTSHLEISPDTGVTTLDTLCGSFDYPGLTKWSLVVTAAQSFDPDATEDVLSTAVDSGGPVAFEVIPYKSLPVSETNPKWVGKVQPAPYAPISGDAGDVSSVELDWAIVEGPTKAIVDAFAAMSEMTLAELQAEAEAQGLSTSGTKAELQERLGAPAAA